MQEFTDIGHGAGEVLRFRQHNDPEVIGLRPIEAAAGHQQDVFFVQEIHSELFIIGDGALFEIDAGENVEGTGIFDHREAIEPADGLNGGFPLLIKAAAGDEQLTGALFILQGGISTARKRRTTRS